MQYFGLRKLQENNTYNIQAIITNETTFYTKNSKLIISLILQDSEKRKIELIAWEEEAKFLQKQNIKLNQMYHIKNLKTINNKKYPKTNHLFKLTLDISTTVFTKITGLEYKKNKTIYIMKCQTKKIKKKLFTNTNERTKQTSLHNWIKPKSN